MTVLHPEKSDGSAKDETTRLLPGIQSEESEMDSRSEAASGTTQVLLGEMEEPWPATFARSISVLATPIMTEREADMYTKSPKPGNTPLFGGPTMTANYRGLRRGFETPDQVRGRVVRPTKSFGDDDNFQDMKKIQSLDFSKQSQSGKKNYQPKMSSEEAHAYRQKLLEGQDNTTPQDGTISPGYDREKQRNQYARKNKSINNEKASFSQCVFNMSNILLGVGMLGLPYVFKSAGWVGGAFVTLFFGFVTWRTSKMIGRQLNGDPRPTGYFDDSPYESPLVPGSSSRARMRPPISSFPQIAREAFGERGNYFLSSVLYFELFSCLCIFVVTIGDHLFTLFPSTPKNLHMVIVSALLTIPTAVLRTPRLLSYLSMVGTFSTILVVIIVFASAVFEGDISEKVAEKKGMDGTEPTHIIWYTPGLPIALGLIAYTFSGHAIVPSIYSSMERPQDFERMIDVTYLVVMSCCLVVAMSGYYMFGSAVDDQVTISLELNSSAVIAMRCLTWLMILTAFSKYTLTMFPLALGIEEIVAPYVPNDTTMAATDFIIKSVLIILALTVACFVPSFSYICALVGLICTMTVSVIFPAAAHLSLFGPRLSLGEKIMDWILVWVGTTVAVMGTMATI